MFATFITVFFVLGIVVKGAVADFAMPTPQLTQCQKAHITWDSTSGPYNLLVVHADAPCDDPYRNLGDHAGTSMSWTVNVPAKSKVALTVQDAKGEEAWTGDIVVGASEDASCLSAKNPASPNLPKNSTTPSSFATSISSHSTNLTVAPSTSPSHSNNTGVGAVNNAGSNPSSSAAFTDRQFTGPVLVMGAFISFVTLL